MDYTVTTTLEQDALIAAQLVLDNAKRALAVPPLPSLTQAEWMQAFAVQELDRSLVQTPLLLRAQKVMQQANAISRGLQDSKQSGTLAALLSEIEAPLAALQDKLPRGVASQEVGK